MAALHDFVTLYDFLGVRPDCDIVAFKNAYRRRVAELHPDRHPDRWQAPRTGFGLQDLTAAYNAALAFQRQHGRLPGAAQARVVRPPAAAVPPRREEIEEARAKSPRRSRRIAFAAAAVGALAWFLVAEQAPQTVSHGEVPAAQAFDPLSPSVRRARARRIELGDGADWVRQLEGRPLSDVAQHWDYGPSWIDFEHGKVKDWYSSPLRPLKVATTHAPAVGAGDRATR